MNDVRVHIHAYTYMHAYIQRYTQKTNLEVQDDVGVHGGYSEGYFAPVFKGESHFDHSARELPLRARARVRYR